MTMSENCLIRLQSQTTVDHLTQVAHQAVDHQQVVGVPTVDIAHLLKNQATVTQEVAQTQHLDLIQDQMVML